METFLSEPHLHVAKIEPISSVNGPGKRFVIWLQGCHFYCPGCLNKEFQSFIGGEVISLKDIMKMIDSTPGIEGVTFSGGEPFDQSYDLFQLARMVKAKGLSVM